MIRQKLYPIILLVFTFPSFVTAQHAVVTGKIEGKIPQPLEYTLPTAGTQFPGFKSEVTTDSLGNFRLSVPVAGISGIELFSGFNSYGTLIVEPGKSYHVTVDTGKKNSLASEGENAAGQALYQQLSNRGLLSGGHPQEISSGFRKDSMPELIRQKMNEKLEAELLPFTKLLEQKKISRRFFDHVKTERRYLYAAAAGSVAFIRHLEVQQKRSTIPLKAYNDLWGSVFQDFPVNSEAMKSSWFYYFAENYLYYRLFTDPSFNIEDLNARGKAGTLHEYRLQKATGYLGPPQAEYFHAAYIYLEALQKNYDAGILDAYKQFMASYPASRYTVFLKSSADEIAAFQAKSARPLNKEIQFVDDYASISSFAALVKKFEGQKLYIDVWATWCGPCKEEFKHVDTLRSLLSDKKVTLVYLSIDNDNRDAQWKKMLKFYDLKGYHVRAGQALSDDLRSLYNQNGSIAIPWYILVNENGTITARHASKPSEPEKLKTELGK